MGIGALRLDRGLIVLFMKFEIALETFEEILGLALSVLTIVGGFVTFLSLMLLS